MKTWQVIERWQVIFEVTLDIQGDESKYAALERAKEAMEKIRGEDIVHYHVLGQPSKVVEVDFD